MILRKSSLSQSTQSYPSHNPFAGFEIIIDPTHSNQENERYTISTTSNHLLHITNNIKKAIVIRVTETPAIEQTPNPDRSKINIRKPIKIKQNIH